MGSAGAKNQLSGEYLWTFPGSPIRVNTPLAVVEQLRQCLESSTGKEHGGVLLGNSRGGHVEISGIKLFDRETDDPYFILSAAEIVALEAQVGRRPQNVVGYFRTDLRGRLRLTDEDLTVINKLFRDPAYVFLVMRINEIGEPMGGFFFRDDETLFMELSFKEFPLDSRQLRTTSSATAGLPRGIPEPVAPTHASEAVRATAKRRLWVVVAALLAAAVALGVSATKIPFQLARQPDAPQAATGPAPAPTFRSALSLSAQKTGNSVAITWDSSALANARIAVVTVQDGDLKQEIPLTQERFKMNKVVYVPQSTQFDVTVEVFSRVGEVIREAIVVATGETSIRARSVAPRIQTTPPPPIAAEEDTPDEAKPSVRRLDLQGALNARTRSPEGTINYVPPPDNSPVPLSTPNVMGPEFLQGSGLPSSLPRPAIPPPARTELVQPVEPARPLRRIQPVVPSNVLAMLKKAVSIHVRVQVDANGKVTAAEPISTTSGVIQYLAASATSVARMWTFTPARRGNTPVASELLLQFDFAQK